MKAKSIQIPGDLVTLPLPGRNRPLDGFWSHGRKRAPALILFVHGMGGNFYRSVSKKQAMIEGPKRGFDVLSFNNRGYERDVATERFTDCLQDIDAAIRFGQTQGYRRFVLLGHSTGCQKITYYQAVRRHPQVVALILAAIGDDYAIARRDLGSRYNRVMAKARRLVASDRGDTIMTERGCLGFSAQRFLSVADPKAIEARIFNFSGTLSHFRSVRCPILALLPENEEFACMPVDDMADILKARTRSDRFDAMIIPNADHGFHGAEINATRVLLDWLKATS